MITKPLKDIVINDFQNLINNGVAESRTIEYKQQCSISQDSEKKEFLYDVSSFANSGGGDLIFGISEDRTTGLPERIEGIEIPNTDEFKRKVESLIRDGIEPRIAGIQIEVFSLQTSKYVFLIRVPKSWNSPHQVVFKGADKFFTRASNCKYKMDLNELRNAFLLSDTITDSVRKFRENRISKIIASETPTPLAPQAKIVLQFIPLTSFEPGKNYDLSTPSLQEALIPLGGGNRDFRYNLDGLLSYATLTGTQNIKAYIQLFRNGIIETVNTDILAPYEGKLLIPSVRGFDYEAKIIETVENVFHVISLLKIEIPIYLYLTILDVKGYSLETSRISYRFNSARTIDRHTLAFPELVLEKYDLDIAQALKPLFDMIWNACGHARSLNYDEAGQWLGPK